MEARGLRRHQRPFAVDVYERVDDLLRTIAVVYELYDVTMHCRRHLAAEVRRAADEHTERAAALAMDAMLELVALLVGHRRLRVRLRRQSHRNGGVLVHREEIPGGILHYR